MKNSILRCGIEVERAKKLVGLSEPSQYTIKYFRARASRAKVPSNISEPERVELWLEPMSQKRAGLSSSSQGMMSQTSRQRLLYTF